MNRPLRARTVLLSSYARGVLAIVVVFASLFLSSTANVDSLGPHGRPSPSVTGNISSEAPATLPSLRTFLDPTPDGGDQFGLTVAEVGANILIGAPLADAGAVDSGAVYLFDPATGALIHTFLNPSPGFGDQFGRAIAAVGGNILVGAPFDDGTAANTGAVYLFSSSTGALLHTFQDPSPAFGDNFGRAVAALGNNMLVGAHEKDIGPAIDAGIVYLYDGITFGLIRTFQKPNPASGDNFGRAVAALGDNILVGTPLDDTAGTDTGAVYLFDSATGGLLHTLLDPTPSFEEEFGFSVAAVGVNAIVGASQDDTLAFNSGAAYLYDGATGILLRTILNPAAADGDKFGRSVAAVGNNILIGAPFDDTAAMDAGVAYLFDGTTGQLLQTFLSPSAAAGDRFGWSVRGVGTDVLIGEPLDDTVAVDAGAGHLLPVTAPPGGVGGGGGGRFYAM